MRDIYPCQKSTAAQSTVFAPEPTFTLVYEIGLNGNPSRWRFVLRSEDGHDEFVAEDEEPGITGERLELLTIARALESLNQSARVIIWTRTPAIRDGLLFGLDEWPQRGWLWQYHERLVPVKNRDLWERISRASRFHNLEYRLWRVDPPHWREHIRDQKSDRSARSSLAYSEASFPAYRRKAGENHQGGFCQPEGGYFARGLQGLMAWLKPFCIRRTASPRLQGLMR